MRDPLDDIVEEAGKLGRQPAPGPAPSARPSAAGDPLDAIVEEAGAKRFARGAPAPAPAATPAAPTRQEVKALAAQHGLRIESGYRDPAHNAAVGDAPRSLHTQRDSLGQSRALDFGGDPRKMQAFSQELQRRYLGRPDLAEVIHRDLFLKDGLRIKGRTDHADHVHVAFREQAGPPAPNRPLPRDTVAGRATLNPFTQSGAYDVSRPRTFLEHLGTFGAELLAPNAPAAASKPRQEYIEGAQKGRFPYLRLSDDPQRRTQQLAEINRIKPLIDEYQRQRVNPIRAEFMQLENELERRNLHTYDPAEYSRQSTRGRAAILERMQAELQPGRMLAEFSRRGVKLTETQRAAIAPIAAARRLELANDPAFAAAIARGLLVNAAGNALGVGLEARLAPGVAQMAGKVLPRLPAPIRAAAATSAGQAAGRILNPARVAGNAAGNAAAQVGLDAADPTVPRSQILPRAGQAALSGAVFGTALDAGGELVRAAARAVPSIQIPSIGDPRIPAARVLLKSVQTAEEFLARRRAGREAPGEASGADPLALPPSPAEAAGSTPPPPPSPGAAPRTRPTSPPETGSYPHPVDDPDLMRQVGALLPSTPVTIAQLRLKLGVGAARAFQIIDTLTQLGIISPPDGTQRKLLILDPDEINRRIETLFQRPAVAPNPPPPWWRPPVQPQPTPAIPPPWVRPGSVAPGAPPVVPGAPTVVPAAPPVGPGTPLVVPAAPPVVPAAPPVVPGTPPVVPAAPPIVPAAPPVVPSPAAPPAAAALPVAQPPIGPAAAPPRRVFTRAGLRNPPPEPAELTLTSPRGTPSRSLEIPSPVLPVTDDYSTGRARRRVATSHPELVASLPEPAPAAADYEGRMQQLQGEIDSIASYQGAILRHPEAQSLLLRSEMQAANQAIRDRRAEIKEIRDWAESQPALWKPTRDDYSPGVWERRKYLHRTGRGRLIEDYFREKGFEVVPSMERLSVFNGLMKKLDKQVDGLPSQALTKGEQTTYRYSILQNVTQALWPPEVVTDRDLTTGRYSLWDSNGVLYESGLWQNQLGMAKSNAGDEAHFKMNKFEAELSRMFEDIPVDDLAQLARTIVNGLMDDIDWLHALQREAIEHGIQHPSESRSIRRNQIGVMGVDNPLANDYLVGRDLSRYYQARISELMRANEEGEASDTPQPAAGLDRAQWNADRDAYHAEKNPGIIRELRKFAKSQAGPSPDVGAYADRPAPKTLDELIDLIQKPGAHHPAVDPKMFIRWSRGPAYDERHGWISHDQETLKRHDGLQVEWLEVNPLKWTDRPRSVAIREEIAELIASFQKPYEDPLPGQVGAIVNPYIVTGKPVASATKNDVRIAGEMQVVALVTPELVAEALDVHAEHKQWMDLANRHGSYGPSANKHREWAADRRRARDMEANEEKRQAEERKKAELGDNYKPMQATGFRSTDAAGETAEIRAKWDADLAKSQASRDKADAAHPVAAQLRQQIAEATTTEELVAIVLDLSRRPMPKAVERRRRGAVAPGAAAVDELFWSITGSKFGPQSGSNLEFSTETEAERYALLDAYRREDSAAEAYEALTLDELREAANILLDARHFWVEPNPWGNVREGEPWSIVQMPKAPRPSANSGEGWLRSEIDPGREEIIAPTDGWSPKRRDFSTRAKVAQAIFQDFKTSQRPALATITYKTPWYTDTHVLMRLDDATHAMVLAKMRAEFTPDTLHEIESGPGVKITSILQPVDPARPLGLIGWMPPAPSTKRFAGPLAIFEDPVSLARVSIDPALMDKVLAVHPDATPWLPLGYPLKAADHPHDGGGSITATITWTQTDDPGSPIIAVTMPVTTPLKDLPIRQPTEADPAAPPKKAPKKPAARTRKRSAKKKPAKEPDQRPADEWIGKEETRGGVETWGRIHTDAEGKTRVLARVEIQKQKYGDRYEIIRETGSDWRPTPPVHPGHEYDSVVLSARSLPAARKLAAELLGSLVTHSDDSSLPVGVVRVPAPLHERLGHARFLPATLDTLPPPRPFGPATAANLLQAHWAKPNDPAAVHPGALEGARQGWFITGQIIVRVDQATADAMMAKYQTSIDESSPETLERLFATIKFSPETWVAHDSEEMRVTAYHPGEDRVLIETSDGRQAQLLGEQFDVIRAAAPKGELKIWNKSHSASGGYESAIVEISVDGKLVGLLQSGRERPVKRPPGAPQQFADTDEGQARQDRGAGSRRQRRRTVLSGQGIGMNAAVPPTARIDPIPTTGPVLRHSQARDRLVQRIDHAVNVSKSKVRAHGMYVMGTGLIMVQKANNPTTVIHEVGHWIDDRYLQSSQHDFRWFDAAMGELVSNPKSSPHGGLNPPIPVADWNDVQRAEAIAEWIHNWAVAPDAAEKHSPKFAAYFKREVPAEIQAAVREYGDWIRSYAGASPVQRTLANVRMQVDSVSAKVLQTLVDLRDVAPHRDHRFRTSARDRIIIQLIDDLHLIPKALRQVKETTGMGPRRALDDPELLMRHHAGLNRKFLGIIEHGMISPDGVVVPQTAGGLAHLLAPFRNTSAEDFRADMADAVAYMIAQRDLNRTSTVVPPHMKTPQRYDRERLRDVDGSLIWPEWDNDKASPTVVQSRRAWWRYRRIIEKAIRAGRPVNAEGVKALEIAFPDPTTYTRAPKSRRLPPQFILPAHYKLDHSPYLPSDKQVYHVPGHVPKSDSLPDRGGRPRGLDEVSGTGSILATDRIHAAKVMQEMSADPVRIRRARDAAARYRAWSNAVLDYLVASGRLSAAVVEQIKAENPLYVDMHRVLGQDRLPEPGAGQPGARKLSNEETLVHRLFGSDLELEHPYVNLLVQTFRAVREADRNRVLATFTKYLSETRFMHGPPEPNQLASIGYKVDVPARGAVTVWRGGKKPEFWIFEAGLQDTLERWGDSLGAGNWLDQALQATAEFMRSMIVHMPDFGVRNSIRDSVQRAVQTGITPAETARYGLEIARSSRAGFASRPGLGSRNRPTSALASIPDAELRARMARATQDLYSAQAAAGGAKTPAVRAARAEVDKLQAEFVRRATTMNPERDLALTGGSGGGHYLANQSAYHEELKRRIDEMRPGGKFHLVSFGGLLRWWKSVMGASEELGREVAYLKATDDMLRAGRTGPVDIMWRASAESRELIDFAVAGRLVRWLNRYIPFTSAQVAGLRAAVRAAKRNPALFAARLALYVILPTVALWAATAARGKQELEEYRQLPSYQRDLFWNIRLAPDVWLSIPKPYDYAMLAAPIERAIDYAAGNRHAWDDLPTNAWNVWMPVDQNTITPAGLKLFLELAINKDIFRGRSIVPEYESRLDVSLRDTTSASRVAQIIQSLTGVDARQVDYAATSVAGTAARTALALSDAGRQDRPTIQRVLGGATGVMRQSPGGNAQDVQKAEALLGRLGLSQSSTADMLKMARRRHSMATTPAEREAAARKLQEIGSRVRERLEQQQKQEQILRYQRGKRGLR